jgi:predicted SAM-dependent methyltransferase
MSNETKKSFAHRFSRGDFEMWFNGRGLDVGAGNDPLAAPYAHVEAFDLQQGDAQFLKKIKDSRYDFVYSSHSLEHMRDLRVAIRNWCRVLKPGGILYIVVPDWDLYEHGIWPSTKNSDHKHSFSLRVTQKELGRNSHWSIYEDIAPVLSENGLELQYVELEDQGYNYEITDPKIDQTHDLALAQICFISKKVGDPHANTDPGIARQRHSPSRKRHR